MSNRLPANTPDDPSSSATHAQRLPLSALRAMLNEGSAATNWSLNPDGVIGRALMMPAGAVFTVPLELANKVTFSARAMLLPHDWRDGRDAVRASVAVIDAAGHRSELWSARVGASDLAPLRGRRFECQLPSWTRSLQLSVEECAPLRPGSVARAIWLEPTVTDPYASPAPERPPRADATQKAQRAFAQPLISILTPVHDPPLHMLEEAIASVRGQTFTRLGAVPGRRRLHQRRDHRSAASATPPQTPASTSSDARQPAGSRPPPTPRSSSPPASTSPCWTTTTRSPPTPCSKSPTRSPRQPDLDMIYTRRGHRHGRPADLGAPQARLVAGHAAHQRLHVSSWRLPASAGLGDRRVSLRVRRLPGRRHDPAPGGAHRPDRPHPADPVPLARPRQLHGRRRRQAVRVRRGAQRDRGATWSAAGSRPRSDTARRASTESRIGSIHYRASRWCWPSRTTQGLDEAARSWVAQPHPTWSVVLAAPEHALAACADALRAAGLADSRVTTIATRRVGIPRPRLPPPPMPPRPNTSCSCRPPPPDSPTTGSPA